MIKKKIGFLAGMVMLVLAGCNAGGYERIVLPGEEPALAGTREPAGTGDDRENRRNLEDGDGTEETGIPQTGDEVEIHIGEPERDPGSGDGAEPEDGRSGGEETGAGLEGGREEPGKDGEITLLFGGDVYLSDHVLRAWETAGGIQGVLDGGYREEIAGADFFLVNQEFPFSSRGVQAPDKQFTFRLPPERVELFSQMGIQGVTLANNHALDFGQDALLDSCAVLDGAGILHTGAGENLEAASGEIGLEISGRRIGIIGATRVIPVSTWAAGKNHPGMLATYDPAVLLERIRQLKETCDYVIVYVHWGVERDEMPQEYQQALARQYVDAGADLVIGAHPHVLQGIQYYEGKPVVYSLGNFVFGSSIPRTMLLKVTIPAGAQDGELKLQVIPGTSSAGYTRMHQDPAVLEEFYRYLEGISFGVSYGEDGTVVQP